MTDQPLDGVIPESYAMTSDDQVYRYTLGRRWEPATGRGSMVMIMLNPSTADATLDDPTIRRCIGFAQSHDCGGLHVVNLYAYRATDPASMWAVEHEVDIVGPDNDDVLIGTLTNAAAEGRPVVAAWGAGARPDRVREVVEVAAWAGCQLLALETTKAGAPGHPLYLPKTARATPWVIL